MPSIDLEMGKMVFAFRLEFRVKTLIFPTRTVLAVIEDYSYVYPCYGVPVLRVPVSRCTRVKQTKIIGWSKTN